MPTPAFTPSSQHVTFDTGSHQQHVPLASTSAPKPRDSEADTVAQAGDGVGDGVGGGGDGDGSDGEQLDTITIGGKIYLKT